MPRKIPFVIAITILFLGACVNPSVAIDSINKSIDFPLQKAPLAYWKSDECDGTTLWDCSGHNYDGTIYADWIEGGCLVFDGVDDYVDLDAHAPNLGLNKTDDYIISFYFKSTSNSTGSIFSMSHTNLARAFVYLDLNGNGTISYKTGDETCLFELYTTKTFNDGDWHFVEIKFYGEAINPTLEIYVDGDLEASLTEWLCPYLAEDFITAKIGRRSASADYPFDGTIDEVILYKYTDTIDPPSPPIIEGKKYGNPGQYIFNFSSIDPQDLDIIYTIDWGDGSPIFISEQMESGEILTRIHTFNLGVYTIRAKATNSYGAESKWSFYEIIISYIPSKPTIDGPTNGKRGVLYDYRFVSTIPGNNKIWYFIDWGDGSFSRWIGPYVSGEEVIKSHRWFICKTYTIRAKAKNVYGMESDWSEFEIEMPRTRASSYLWFLERFPMLERLLSFLLL